MWRSGLTYPGRHDYISMSFRNCDTASSRRHRAGSAERLPLRRGGHAAEVSQRHREEGHVGAYRDSAGSLSLSADTQRTPAATGPGVRWRIWPLPPVRRQAGDRMTRLAEAPETVASEASPAGPAAPGEALRAPPAVSGPRPLLVLRFTQRQIELVFRARRELGEVFAINAGISGGVVVTCHPDHVRSLFTASPELVPSLTAESPLRPIVGPASVLTANGARHLRQRRLLLPSFHGEAVDRYTEMIERVTEQELDRWPVGRPFPLAPHAGDHARGDHVRHLRGGGHPRARKRRAPPVRDDQAPHDRVDITHGKARRADELRAPRAGRLPALGRLAP